MIPLVRAMFLALLAAAAPALSPRPVTAASARTINVFAAASLSESFGAIGAAFERARPEWAMRFNFAGSSTLVRQILDKAPADVFAAADTETMQQLVTAGELAGTARPFAGNSLTIAVPSGNPGHIAALADLARKDVTLVLAAPGVPAGKYAAEIFAKAGLAVPSASEEPDVKAVLNKVALGEADAGIVYVTDVRAAADRVEQVPIPPALNVAAVYLIAALRHAADPAAAAAFVDFVLSADGRQILARFGFTAP